jgi:hypothetical protein
MMSSFYDGAAGTIFCAPEHLSIAAFQHWPLKLCPRLHRFLRLSENGTLYLAAMEIFCVSKARSAPPSN